MIEKKIEQEDGEREIIEGETVLVLMIVVTMIIDIYLCIEIETVYFFLFFYGTDVTCVVLLLFSIFFLQLHF